MTAADPVAGRGAVVALLVLSELMDRGVVDVAAVGAARSRLLRSGGELLLDDWAERVETVTAALRTAASAPARRRDLFKGYLTEVQAGEAALAVLPKLVEMYPEVAAELPEAVAGLARYRVVSVAGGVALLERIGGIEEAEARFCHALEAQRGAGRREVADA